MRMRLTIVGAYVCVMEGRDEWGEEEARSSEKESCQSEVMNPGIEEHGGEVEL